MRHGLTVLTLRPSYKLKHRIIAPPVKFHKIASGGKVVASVFSDSEGVLMIDYLEKGKTVRGSYYVELIRKLHTVIQEK